MKKVLPSFILLMTLTAFSAENKPPSNNVSFALSVIAIPVNEILAEVYDSSNNPLTTYAISLNAYSWAQRAISVNVSGGFIKWKAQQTAYCYAVVVDNNSNDGTFIPALPYIP